MDKRESAKAEIDRLYRLYYQKDKEFESAKLKRIILTVLGFSVVFFWIFYQLSEPSGWEILQVLVLSVIFSGFYCFINVCIFAPLALKGRDEGDQLREIKRKIDELQKEL